MYFRRVWFTVIMVIIFFTACKDDTSTNASEFMDVTLYKLKKITADDNDTEARFYYEYLYDNYSHKMTSISSDGQYIAFSSHNSNLVSNDTNGVSDIFVLDQFSETVERISINRDSIEGNQNSYNPSISADGQYVVFTSAADNLVPEDNDGNWDIFVYERNKSTIERLSINNDGMQKSYQTSISADGRYVAFASESDNLVVGDTNGVDDVFVYDRNTSTIERVSINNDGTEGNQWSMLPSISGDGRYVAFASAADNLVPDDNNEKWDVFVFDRNTKRIERISVNNEGIEGSRDSYYPSISGDGRYVAFYSLAHNFVAGDTNAIADVFLYDRETKTIELVSVSRSGSGVFWENHERCAISYDGGYVVYSSKDGNLVYNDDNLKPDIFIYDRLSKTTNRVSIDNNKIESNKGSFLPSVNADGTFIAFSSWASRFDDMDIYVAERTKTIAVPKSPNVNDTIKRVQIPLTNSCPYNMNIYTQMEFDQLMESFEVISLANNSDYATRAFLEGLKNAKIDFNTHYLLFHDIGFSSLPNIFDLKEPEIYSDRITIDILYDRHAALYSASQSFCLAYVVDKNISNVTFQFYDYWNSLDQ